MLDVFIIAIFSVLMTSMLKDWMEPGLILGRYKKWLDKHDHLWFYKPLGGCFMCFNVWVTFFGIAMYWLEPSLFNILAVVSLSHFIITLLDAYELL